ncbi:hypothetical protein C8Q79DRAFT_399137 [Trametes meyenii]|nr:hypothetical protein C8Q79DRAFT_399137 [Trametes meyenii]
MQSGAHAHEYRSVAFSGAPRMKLDTSRRASHWFVCVACPIYCMLPTLAAVSAEKKAAGIRLCCLAVRVVEAAATVHGGQRPPERSEWRCGTVSLRLIRSGPSRACTWYYLFLGCPRLLFYLRDMAAPYTSLARLGTFPSYVFRAALPAWRVSVVLLGQLRARRPSRPSCSATEPLLGPLQISANSIAAPAPPPGLGAKRASDWLAGSGPPTVSWSPARASMRRPVWHLRPCVDLSSVWS